MAFKEEKLAGFRRIIEMDAGHDLIRLLSTEGSSQFDEKYLRLLQEDDNTEKDYKYILHRLCTVRDLLNLHVTNDKDDVIEHEKRWEALKKWKAEEDTNKHDDDCNGSEEENDPQYELFLKHLKEHDKSYALEYEEDRVLVVMKYEGDIAFDKGGGPELDCRRKVNRAHNVVNENLLEKQDRRMLTRALEHECGPSKRMRGEENQCKHDPRSISIKKTTNADKAENVHDSRYDTKPNPKYPFLQQNAKLGGDYNVSEHKGHTITNKKINDQKREDGRKLPIAMKHESRFLNQTPEVENQQRSLVKKTMVNSLAHGKSRNETDKEENPVHRNVKLEDYPHVHMHEVHSVVNDNIGGVNDRKKHSGRNWDRNKKQKVELSHQMPHLKNERKRDLQPVLAKNTKSSARKKSRDEAQNLWFEKCSASEFRKVKAAKCIRTYKNSEENNLEKEGKGTSDSDLEILDESAYLKKGIFSPFVSSKKFSKSMEDGIQRIGGSSLSDEFRKRVLNILKKPYDREEYMRHLEAVQAGCYFRYHADLKKKLKKYRYNQRKRLAILRGFFFWVQNLTQEGAFKPWKDRACLAVEPPSP